MKKLFASVFALALVFSAAQAQEITERKKDRSRERHGASFRNLDLTEDQKSKMKEANDDFRKQMAELRKQDDITVKESRTRMENLRKDHQAKVQGFLTPEQKTKMEEMKKERKKGMGDRKHGMKGSKGRKGFHKGGHGSMEKMKENLGLTEDQVSKMKANREATSAKMKALRDDKSLSREARKEKAKEIMKGQKDALKSVLTEEQLKKMKEMKEGKKERKENKAKGIS